MCGFISVFSKDSTHSLVNSIKEKAIPFIHHRGPDDSGSFQQDGVFMHFNRLSIIDPSPAGHQPMHSACGRYVITYNGEIYNFRKLIERYHLQNLKGHCDSEVLLEPGIPLGLNLF